MADEPITGWQSATLESLAALITKGTTPTTYGHAYVEQGVPFLRVENINERGGLDLRSVKFISSTTHKALARSCLQPGDLLFSIAGALGRVARVPSDLSDSNINQAIALVRLRLDAKVDGDFLKYALQSQGVRAQVALVGAQLAQANLNLQQVSALRVPVPPFPEQRKIAAILSSVDDTIEKTQAVIDQLEVLKKGLLGELLTRGMPGQHREFRETEIGLIPSSWRVARVGDCCEVENHLRKPLNQRERETILGPYPYYGPTRALSYISEYRVDGTYSLIGEDGDHFLKFKKWPMTQLVSGRFNVNNHAHLVHGTESCLTEWFFYFFLHRDITERLTRQGANRYKLKKETLLALPLALPPPSEQREIVEALSTVEPAIAATTQVLEQLRTTKAALSGALLSGLIRASTEKQGTA